MQKEESLRKTEPTFGIMFPVKVVEKDGRKKTYLLSFKKLRKPLIFFVSYFVSLFVMEYFYHDPLLKKSLSPNGYIEYI